MRCAPTACRRLLQFGAGFAGGPSGAGALHADELDLLYVSPSGC